jgi:hypothetical protein
MQAPLHVMVGVHVLPAEHMLSSPKMHEATGGGVGGGLMQMPPQGAPL